MDTETKAVRDGVGDAALAAQVASQCQVVAHLADALARVHSDYVKLAAAPVFQGIADQVGARSARFMEMLGDALNEMDAASPDDEWTHPIFETAQRLFPAPELSGLAAPSAAGSGEIPEGWALVPREPTPEMLRASRRAISDLIEGMPLDERIRQFSRSKRYGFKIPTGQKAAARYRAMIAAAPSPSQGSDTGEAGREPKGLGHSRAELSGLGPQAECPSRGWQPIATAPRSGKEVYLWAEAWEGSWGVQIGRFEYGQWHTEEGTVDDNEPDFDPDAEVGEDFDPDELKNLGPTHWAPFGRRSRPPPAPCDRSPEGGETQCGSTEGESAVPEGQAPNSPTAPQGADLAGLSAAATQGEWRVSGQRMGGDWIVSTAERVVACFRPWSMRFGDDRNEADARFACAVVNAYRSGALVPTTSAPPAVADRKDINPNIDVSDGRPVTVDYINYRGERGERRILPNRIVHGATEYHPRHQWLLEAWDLDKGAMRVFALEDMRFLDGDHPGSVAPKILDLIRQARQAASAERALYGDSKGAGDLYDELADALGDASRVVAPTFGERGEVGDTGTEWFWRIVDADGLGDVPSDEEAALRLLCRRASAYEIAQAFQAADAEDWRRLFLMLDDSGHGRFWQERLRAALAALNAAPPPVSQTEGERPCP